MKKLLLLCSVLVSATCVLAQGGTNYLKFFPNTQGTQLINKTYDGSGKAICTTTMTVTKSYDFASGSDIQLSSITVDSLGKTINKGTIEARYDNDAFYLKMSNYMSPVADVMKALSMENEISADFLDYPNTLTTGEQEDLNPVFRTPSGQYTITTTGAKGKTSIHVKNYNRRFEGLEDIYTPAGVFKAYRITYDIEVTGTGMKKARKLIGSEWFAEGAGIVRSEVYEGKQLLNYTMLDSIKRP